MGLLQAAYETYEAQAHRAGVVTEGEREPLTPVSHIIANAQIEITLSDDGVFQSARAVPKEEKKTIIPVTMDSASRTSTKCVAHPLSDQLRYLAPYGGRKFEAYVSQLQEWVQSPFSHPALRAVYGYIRGGSIVSDLAAEGILTLNEAGNPSAGRIEGIDYDKCLVRWRVIPEQPSDCFKNPALFQSFAQFYAEVCKRGEQDVCMITGQEDRVCQRHPKGVAGGNDNSAKLISANDKFGFTYRGRFSNAEQACCVGYMASQKAHNALRWVAANQAVRWGGRAFLCWNPKGKPVPSFDALGFAEESPPDFISYQSMLQKTLYGHENSLCLEDDVIIAGLDAATTGRLSVTYYNELKGSDFLERLERWYTTCCITTRFHKTMTPTIYQIVTRALGVERGGRIEADERVLREHAQQMVSCIVDCRPIPKDLVRALVERASTPLAYNEPNNRESVLTVAYALVRKYRNDDLKLRNGKETKEEWTLGLNKLCTDRSYLFGRWLAVMEHVERSTYDKDEGREPNAIRMQAVFTRRPLYASAILAKQLEPYFKRLKPSLRIYYENLLNEITSKLEVDDGDAKESKIKLEKSLEDLYLLGYYHQRAAFYEKKDTKLKTEEN